MNFHASILAGSKSPNQQLAQLSLLTHSERHQLLVEWNATEADYLPDRCIHQLFEAQAAHTPDVIAVLGETQALTYGGLNRRANQLAHHLRGVGAGPESPVAIYLERSHDLIVGILGTVKAGGAHVPLHPLTPRIRLAFMLDELPALAARVICLDGDWRDAIAPECSQDPVLIVTADHLAYVIYTSGSTGQPKGVQLLHRGLVNLVHWHRRVCQVTAADHAPLLAETVLNQPLPDGFVLMQLLTGGDKLHRMPEERLPCTLFNNYGPAEITVVATWTFVATDDLLPSSIGRPVDNICIYLLDENLNPVPVGVLGELCIGGVGLSRGYLNRPDLTAKSFIPHPFSSEPGARLYKTGDKARYLPDGRIEFLGRLDFPVKIRSFRIELGEMRRFLVERLPDYMALSFFVPLQALPLTPNGKVDRRALPSPDVDCLALEGTYVAPRNPTEEGLAGIWQEILGVERVGAHDGFFELGGHSLLVTQVISRVRTLFKAPTVADLARSIEAIRWAAQGTQSRSFAKDAGSAEGEL